MDFGYLAAAYSVPEPRLTELLDAPTADLIKEFLQKAEEKAHAHDKAQADKLRTDVELESALRNNNARAKQLQDSKAQHLKEVEEIKEKLTEERMLPSVSYTLMLY
jgi:hypothetical protein